jgi:hypothetical protein
LPEGLSIGPVSWWESRYRARRPGGCDTRAAFIFLIISPKYYTEKQALKAVILFEEEVKRGKYCISVVFPLYFRMR